MEWLALVLTMSMVLALEMVNTAIERCVDLATSDYKELAKALKEAGYKPEEYLKKKAVNTKA